MYFHRVKTGRLCAINFFTNDLLVDIQQFVAETSYDIAVKENYNGGRLDKE